MIRERNFRKHPHTARFLMAFHAGTAGLPSDVEEGHGEDLLDLVPAGAPIFTPSASQASFMNDMIRDITAMDAELGRQAEEYTAKMDGHWTPGREGNLSRWLDRLRAKRADLRLVARVTPAPQGKPVAAPTGITEDGMYLFEGEIYKVQFAVNGSGRLYAKLLVRGAEGENATFEYAHGVVTRLRPEHKMTLEQAKEYGALYGVCVRCGRVLTKESSIAQSMGDKCASKF